MAALGAKYTPFPTTGGATIGPVFSPALLCLDLSTLAFLAAEVCSACLYIREDAREF